ncbi:efflux RND transporter periplasmic adaptor subunit [Gemmatimonas groenlandica]|uniref:Efflux RND transporter periplasmic adaptor subunit n=1 Tax=Gemmatimonas groenlandica TaxID=2732249 RepID=A0A6M4IQI6_9BACT|nr:efflux RND transporter periplasmic adaptor subunit [Gemmatimonas groenlandica]QJR35747.1 efflux RND transporter periplasmic adaptor subunit [Gemmatimonas groenlandica]
MTLGAVVLLAIFIGCRSGGDDSEATSEADAAPRASAVTATTTRVDTATFTEIVDAVGVVTARMGGEASLSAPAPTRVVRILVTVGDRVTPGQALVEFEPALFEAAWRSTESARETAEQAQVRAERLVAAGVMPRRELEQANAQLASARADALAADRARQLSTLRTPIAGVVTRVAAVRGANVNEQQSLVDIADPDHVDVVLQLAPDVAHRVRVGQPVTLRLNAATGAASIGTGRVADIAALVDSSSRAVAVRVAVQPSSEQRRLGETVFGSIVAESHHGAVVLPEQALVPHEEGYRVFVVDSAGVAHARDVSVGGRSAQGVWIRDGVRRGETVVTAGAYGLDDGSSVVSAGAKR